jgi:GH43 family beta-xylosidase
MLCRLFPDDPDFGGIDGTVFKHGNGVLYYVWTSFAMLYIAPMVTPEVIGGPKTVLREPTTDWECTPGCQAEGPYFIYNRNVSYVVFSGSGSFDAT